MASIDANVTPSMTAAKRRRRIGPCRRPVLGASFGAGPGRWRRLGDAVCGTPRSVEAFTPRPKGQAAAHGLRRGFRRTREHQVAEAQTAGHGFALGAEARGAGYFPLRERSRAACADRPSPLPSAMPASRMASTFSPRPPISAPKAGRWRDMGPNKVGVEMAWNEFGADGFVSRRSVTALEFPWRHRSRTGNRT